MTHDQIATALIWAGLVTSAVCWARAFLAKSHHTLFLLGVLAGLIMAIAGGALATGQAWIADHYGLQVSFLVPALCEVYVLFYALWGSKPAKLA